MKNEKNVNEKQQHNNDLVVKLGYEVVGRFTNLFITTPKGTRVQVRLAFPNRKLIYKLICEIEGK